MGPRSFRSIGHYANDFTGTMKPPPVGVPDHERESESHWSEEMRF